MKITGKLPLSIWQVTNSEKFFLTEAPGNKDNLRISTIEEYSKDTSSPPVFL